MDQRNIINCLFLNEKKTKPLWLHAYDSNNVDTTQKDYFRQVNFMIPCGMFLSIRGWE